MPVMFSASKTEFLIIQVQEKCIEQIAYVTMASLSKWYSLNIEIVIKYKKKRDLKFSTKQNHILVLMSISWFVFKKIGNNPERLLAILFLKLDFVYY